MKAYFWDIPNEYPETRIGEYNQDISPDEYLFRKGKYITESLPKIVVSVKRKKELIEGYGAIPNSSGSPIIREDVLELCKDLFRDQVQAFDVELHTANEILNNYKLLNVLNILEDCINFEESIYSYYDKEKMFKWFDYMVLKDNCLGNLNIARISEGKKTIVSKTVKDLFKKYKVKGVDICTPEEHYASIYNLEKIFKDAGRVWKGLPKEDES